MGVLPIEQVSYIFRVSLLRSECFAASSSISRDLPEVRREIEKALNDVHSCGCQEVERLQDDNEREHQECTEKMDQNRFEWVRIVMTNMDRSHHHLLR